MGQNICLQPQAFLAIKVTVALSVQRHRNKTINLIKKPSFFPFITNYFTLCLVWPFFLYNKHLLPLQVKQKRFESRLKNLRGRSQAARAREKKEISTTVEFPSMMNLYVKVAELHISSNNKVRHCVHISTVISKAQSHTETQH